MLFLDEPATGLDPEARRRAYPQVSGLPAHRAQLPAGGSVSQRRTRPQADISREHQRYRLITYLGHSPFSAGSASGEMVH
jgi:hypothetical protein